MAPLIGTFLVHRQLALIGDALAHGVLPGIAAAVLLGLPAMLGAALGAVVMIGGVALVQRRSRLSSDTSIGLLFVAMLALGVVMISANDVAGYPADGPEKMADLARNRGFEFPYLYDESQRVAVAYRAACTPDFFLFDENHRLVYRGQYDGSRPGNSVAVDGRDMRAAVDALLAGDEITGDQIPSVGCNIKWRAGNEPDYF